MKRIVKDPKTRRQEILTVAGELFRHHGYAGTTVEAIIQKACVAKGTFYYYFKSKEQILDALVHELVDQLCEAYRQIADDPAMGVMDKLRHMLRGQHQLAVNESELMEGLHRPENRELHERINIEIIMKISPVLAHVVEQGKKESLFDVEYPLETVQFLLAGSQFLLESGLFHWNQEEQTRRLKSMQTMIERSLGAKRGSFSFI
ncbi:TetR/AcrR family transcriptional regulator [Paenibacillus tyrfis]|uniref:TetR/AcrR family transcriptional regulator n=1 Tax=Paenibacillus tyrfis TaxID=1501230 RepID=UPI0020A0FC13|nr:TetR/AcrR family transcriptional regulator [Paenibacillus tyrfis]MCP1308180.1 TetR/AcrR family transcriptional regulator [Paenibacillus tyrfis]